VKDGALAKYEFKLKGKIKFGDNEFPNDRTTTVEIKDLNNTKVEVPEAVRKKLSLP
jgi:phosphate-selective porin